MTPRTAGRAWAASGYPPDVPPAPAAPDRPILTGLSLAGLRDLFARLGEPSFRAEQLFRAIWKEGRTVEETTTLSKGLRERLLACATPSATSVVESVRSDDGTIKLLVGLEGGARVETVMIPEGDRRTVCVSTQVGCPIGCVFCASGVGGLVRNLAVAEIAEQVLHVRRALGERPTNIVVMGMGEPLLNLPALSAAIAIWADEAGMNFGARRITVSTAGTALLIDRLAALELGVHLAVSLHGPDDATVEYVLIAGENDRPAHADALAELVRGRHIHVNLIPLNPVAHRKDLRAPSGVASRDFLARLHDAGVSATLRTQRGDDIAAACGQLALERALSGRNATGGAP